MQKRIWLSILLGAVLGIACIIGIGFRLGFDGNMLFLFSAWYNRVIMGLIIGLATPLVFTKNKFNPVIRGAVIGTLVSYSWYVASGNRDSLGFFAGIGYGIIIDLIATKYAKVK